LLQFLFDTDHLTLFEQNDPALRRNLTRRGLVGIGLSVVTVEESLRGRLAALSRSRDGPTRILNYARLVKTVEQLRLFPIVPFDQAAENFSQQFRSVRIGTQDLKIAATALANNLTLLTRNRRDFGRVPGLQLDDWSV